MLDFPFRWNLSEMIPGLPDITDGLCDVRFASRTVIAIVAHFKVVNCCGQFMMKSARSARYYLLQKTGIPVVDVQSMVKRSLCDAYVAATFVPEEGDGRTNGIASCVSEHYSISTGCNMTAMSIGEKICVSTKVATKFPRRCRA